MMAMERYDGVVISSAGAPVIGTTVTIKLKSTGLAATIYSDEGITPKANPTTTDADGRFWFYAADDDYVVEAAGGFTLGDVTLYSGIAREQLLRKTGDETVNNSLVLQDDDDLVFAVAANETWEFEANLLVTSAAAAGFDWDFTMPAATTYTRKTSWLWDGTTIRVVVSTALDTEDSHPGAVAVLASDVLIIRGLIVNGANAGSVQLRWAQNVADVSDTKVLAGSYLRARRVG